MSGQHYSLEISHLQRMELAITQLWERVAAIPFRHEVRSEDVPDYYSVVSTPMSLSTVLGKLKRKEYLNPNTVRGDMDILFRNCFTYNMPGCPIYNYGKQLKKSFEELMVEVGLEGRKRPAPRRHEEFGSSIRYNFLDEDGNDRPGKRFHTGVAAGLRPFKKTFTPRIVGGDLKQQATAAKSRASETAQGKSGEEEVSEVEDEEATPAAPSSPAGTDAEMVEANEAADDGAAADNAIATNKAAVPAADGDDDDNGAHARTSAASSAEAELEGGESSGAKRIETTDAADNEVAANGSAATEQDANGSTTETSADANTDGTEAASPKTALPKRQESQKKQAAAAAAAAAEAAQKRPQRAKGKKGVA